MASPSSCRHTRNMNSTSDSTPQPPPQSAPQPPPQPPSQPASGFFAWIRGLGIVRDSDRWFAGVAGGIATRTGIDPLIIRGIFVVLTLLGGPGILLYLAGWLLLPSFTGRIRLEELFQGRGEGWTIVTLVVVPVMAIPALLNLFSQGAFGWTMAPWGAFGLPGWLSTTVTLIVWIAVIVFSSIWISRAIRARRSAHLGSEQPRPQHDEQPRPQHDTRSESSDQTSNAWGNDFSKKADAWGNDFSKLTDEWSAHHSERHAAHKLGSAHVIITLALALLAGGITAIWAVGLGAEFAAGAELAVGLVAGTAILAVSLIVAGIRGKNTGWIGFLASCGVVALLFTSVFPAGTRFQPFGTMHVDGSVERGAVQIAGNMPIDLTGLDRSTGRSPKDIDLDAWQFAGRATVTMPKVRPTIITVNLFAGSISEQRGDTQTGLSSGPFLSQTISANLNRADGEESIKRVTLNMFAGSVLVQVADTQQRADADADRTHIKQEITERKPEATQ